MKMRIIACGSVFLLAAAVEAGVRVYVQDTNGVAWIKYECTAGELIRAFALDVAVDRGQITGISKLLQYRPSCHAFVSGLRIPTQ